MRKLKLNLSHLRLLAIPLFLGAGFATASAADELVYESGTISTNPAGWKVYSSDNNAYTYNWAFYSESPNFGITNFYGAEYNNDGTWVIIPIGKSLDAGTYYVKGNFCTDPESVAYVDNAPLNFALLTSNANPGFPGTPTIHYDTNPPANTNWTEIKSGNLEVDEAGTYSYIGVYTNGGLKAGVAMQYLNLYKVDAGAPIVYPTAITLDKTSVSLLTTEKATLTATVTPDDAADKTVTWTTSDDAVATVNAYGVVTAVGAGTATITASVNGESTTIKTTCSVTVTDYVGTVGMGSPYEAYDGEKQFKYWNMGNWVPGTLGNSGIEINTNEIGENGWLISHPITFEQGDAYTIDLQCSKYGSDCTFAIYYGNAANNLTNKVGNDITVATADWGSTSRVLAINTPGTYYIGIKAPSSTGEDFLMLKNLSITNTTVKTANGYKFTNKEAVAASGAYNDPDARLFDLTGMGFYDAALPTAANTNAITLIKSDDKSTGGNIVKDFAAEDWRTDGINLTDGAGNFYYGHNITGPANYSRTVVATPETPKYVTCVLPYAITKTDGMYTIGALTGDKINFNDAQEGTLPAYTPFIYKATGDIEFSGKDIAACDGYDADKDLVVKSIDGSSWSYAVTFKKTDIADVNAYTEFTGKDVYFFQNNAFYKATGHLVTNPFRVLYLCPKGTTPEKLKLYINDDVPTGLEELYRLQDEIENGPAYNEAGIRVDNSYKGIKIRNGKKVIENK